MFDGFLSLERGVDSGRAPATLERNQCAFAVNTSFRGGFPASRPGFLKRPLTFKNSSGETNTNLWAAFQDGQFQGAEFYDGITGESCLVASIGGKIFRILVGHEFQVADITPAQRNSSRLTKAWFCQAEEFMLIQDGQSKPIVYDGSGTWRLTRDDDLPVGCAMAYGQGRVWVTLPDRHSFVAGDLVYSASGTPERGYRDALLKATENSFLSEGGAFGMPANSGGIRCLTFTSNLDTSLGQGPLLALTPTLVASVQAPIDRDAWKALEYPIQSVSLKGYGALSDGATVEVNGDVFYRSVDGVRSFTMARREFGQWGNTPISSEMNRVLDADTDWLLENGSAVVWDNRLYITVSPYFIQGHGVPHRGLAVMDLDVLSRMTGKLPPAWDGIWTGLTILKLVKGRFAGQERCFAFVLNGAKQIELWELTSDYPHDRGDVGDSRIAWAVELKSYDWGLPFDLKRMEYGELFVDEMSGTLEVKASYRADGYPLWVDWHTGWQEIATEHMDDPDDEVPPLEARAQSRSKMRLPRVPNLVNESDNRPMNLAFNFQPRLEFIGRGRLRQARFAATPEPEHSRGAYRT
jgi:hypothetical protein